MSFYSPLRYPGGKRKIASFIEAFIDVNGLNRHTYVEPYAGGAAVAVHLLIRTKMRVIVNDIDPCIFAFWSAVRDEPTEFCRRLSRVRVDVEQWRKQRAVLTAARPCQIDLAVATMFLNRTNRSGVLLAGVIGGLRQSGRWKMSVRFNKRELIRRIEEIATHSMRLDVQNKDGVELVGELGDAGNAAVLFLDPPYYHKTDRLYRDDYGPQDHANVAAALRRSRLPWILTYDDCREIRRLYRGFRSKGFGIRYTVGPRRVGSEVLVVSNRTIVPNGVPICARGRR